MSLIPLDIVAVISAALDKQQRPWDGMLHPSSDLAGSLRHAQLSAAGAPRLDSSIAARMPLLIGTLIHEWMGKALEAEGIAVMREVRLEGYLPEGWAGTADFLFYSPEQEGWVLADLKTQKGEAYHYTRDHGAKEEHIWQISAYWWALVEMGLPMVEGLGIIYLPKNDTTDKNENVEIVIAECTPLSRDDVWEEMKSRWEATQAFLNTLEVDGFDTLEAWVENLEEAELAPVQDRVQRMWWSSKDTHWDVKLVPHWSAAYCPFPNELCDCSEQGTTKIGHYYWYEGDGLEDAPDRLIYEARSGYEDIEPTVAPDTKELRRRTK